MTVEVAPRVSRNPAVTGLTDEGDFGCQASRGKGNAAASRVDRGVLATSMPGAAEIPARAAGILPAALRVVLSIDGRPEAEQAVEVPAGGAVDVVLRWRAEAGRNVVRLQAFPA